MADGSKKCPKGKRRVCRTKTGKITKCRKGVASRECMAAKGGKKRRRKSTASSKKTRTMCQATKSIKIGRKTYKKGWLVPCAKVSKRKSGIKRRRIKNCPKGLRGRC